MQTLKAFRKKNGLCFRCGNKWGHGHHCPENIPLHVVEELFDALELELPANAEIQEPDVVEEAIMAMDATEKSSDSRRRAFRFLATIGKQKVLVLVNSGSIGTFVSQHLVQQLKLPVQQCPQTQFKAADGGILSSTQVVPEVQWLV